MTSRPDHTPTDPRPIEETEAHAWNPAALKRFVRRLGKSSADCEDIVQEAYLRLLESSGRGRTVGSQMGYLLVIARNLVTDAGRREAREGQRRLALRVLRSQLNPSEPSAEEMAFVAQARERLGKAILALPPRVRHIYLLHRFQAMRHQDIAKHLGVTTRTVERDIAFALTQLKEVLFEGDPQ